MNVWERAGNSRWRVVRLAKGAVGRVEKRRRQHTKYHEAFDFETEFFGYKFNRAIKMLQLYFLAAFVGF